MATKPNVKSFQDMPPKGGYPGIDYKKGTRPRGPSGFVIWSAIIGATVYGFYMLGSTNDHRRLLRAEKREAKMSITPYLMAEKDRELRAIRKLQLEQEAAIMQHVPEWKVGESVFKSKA